MSGDGIAADLNVRDVPVMIGVAGSASTLG
jgi:hypothetical protein